MPLDSLTPAAQPFSCGGACDSGRFDVDFYDEFIRLRGKVRGEPRAAPWNRDC